MTRHYSTKSFFRQMPNALLARYFQRHGLFDELDFVAMKEAHPDELFTAWLELPDDRRKPMDAELLGIFEMSCEKGFCAIRDEAQWHLKEEPQAYTEFVEKLAALANHYERAIVTFLDHPKFWKGATLFYHIARRTGESPANQHLTIVFSRAIPSFNMANIKRIHEGVIVVY